MPVKDIERAAEFYSTVLGQKGNRISVNRHYFNLGGVILACMEPPKDKKGKQETWQFHPIQYIYIAVKDLKQVYGNVKKAECKELGEIEKMPWGEKLFYAQDPFGNPICFVDEETIFTG